VGTDSGGNFRWTATYISFYMWTVINRNVETGNGTKVIVTKEETNVYFHAVEDPSPVSLFHWKQSWTYFQGENENVKQFRNSRVVWIVK
jgi:hypothetical protein